MFSEVAAIRSEGCFIRMLGQVHDRAIRPRVRSGRLGKTTTHERRAQERSKAVFKDLHEVVVRAFAKHRSLSLEELREVDAIVAVAIAVYMHFAEPAQRG